MTPFAYSPKGAQLLCAFFCSDGKLHAAMRRLLFVLLFTFSVSAENGVTILHFSDYHSHALPIYTDDGPRGGIARAIGYLKREKQRGALVFSGGDTMNAGAPAWSDKYGCVEWSWLNGLTDAMAFGNHDADYGREAFERCRSGLRYPLLSANTEGFERYRVFEAGGLRIGVFALAGPDFQQLVKTPGFSFEDPVAAAREVVRELREKERVDAVVLIGHEHSQSDYALARSVPGIDVIFGSHSHLLRELTRIPETDTWFISPGQYLGHISRVVLTVVNGKVSVRGELVPVDGTMKEDRSVARRVRKLQRDLERDPRFASLFVPIGRLDAPLSSAALATRTLAVMRTVSQADVALSTASSFRRPLPAGALTPELLRGSLPYDNEIVTCSMTGLQLQQLLDAGAARKGSDSEFLIAGLTAIDPEKSYRVATTDYVAFVAYKDAFHCERVKTGLRVREELRKALTANVDVDSVDVVDSVDFVDRSDVRSDVH